MSRQPRVAPGGFVQHVLNHAVGSLKLFASKKDFITFENLLIEAQQRHPIRILAYCMMRDHWHIVVWPKREGEVTAFFRWLTHTHAMRWRSAHRSLGYGPVYRGRFKTFVVEPGDSVLDVCRFVERKSQTAGVVRRAQDWQWSSLWARAHGSEELQSILSDWPVDRPANWTAQVNRPMPAHEKEAMELSIKRSRPFGSEKWTAKTVSKLHLEHTVRSEGRPRLEKGIDVN